MKKLLEKTEWRRRVQNAIRQEEEKKRILKPFLDRYELLKDQYNFLDEYEKILKKEIREFDKLPQSQMVNPDKQFEGVINRLDQQIKKAQLIVENLEEVEELTAEDDTDMNSA